MALIDRSIQAGALTPVIVAGGNMVINNAIADPVLVTSRNPITVITQTPAITAGAYAAGDVVGGLLTFINAALAIGRGGYIVKVLITDNAGQAVPYELHLFDRTFAAMADNAAWSPSDANMLNWEGYVDIAATDQAAGAANSGAAKSTGLRCPFPYYCVGTSLFGQLVIRGTPTYAATDNIRIKIYVEKW